MKPGTFTQMYVQLVFAVKNRDAVLKKDFRERVFEYMSGIITNLKHKSMIINGTSNHVHILFVLNPSEPITSTRYVAGCINVSTIPKALRAIRLLLIWMIYNLPSEIMNSHLNPLIKKWNLLPH
jgi:hypothetical protein